MIVTNHQIQNVLKVYTSQLSRGRMAVSESMPIRKPFADAVDISAEGKRQALIERLTKAIVGRIIRKDPRLHSDSQAVQQLKSEIENDVAAREGQELEFAYNLIDGDATKTLNTLSMEDPTDLIKRLEHHAREAVEKNDSVGIRVGLQPHRPVPDVDGDGGLSKPPQRGCSRR